MQLDLRRQMGRVHQGDHVCMPYRTPVDAAAVAAAFLRDGLARGERCVAYGFDALPSRLDVALAAAGVDVASQCARGALQLVPLAAAPAGAASPRPDALIAYVRELECRALADGYTGLRITGDMGWAADARHSQLLTDYEAGLGEMLPGSRTTALCAFALGSFAPSQVEGMLRTHPLAMVDGRVCVNPFHETPAMVMGGAVSARERIDRWMHQLERACRLEWERDRIDQQRQLLAQRLLKVQDAERRRLARELHDEVGQVLTGLRLLLKSDPPVHADGARGRLDQARNLVDELIEKVRALSFDLMPAALEQLGLLPALLGLFERSAMLTGIQVDFKHSNIEGVRFEPEVETSAYRIVQEALTNVARHAGVAGTTVRAWADSDTVRLQVEDRGAGFDPDLVLTGTRSSGLAGMRERAELLGGQLAIESRPGGGTQVTAELPRGPRRGGV